MQFGTIGGLLITYQGEFNETTHQHLLTKEPDAGVNIYRGGNVQRYNFIDVAKQGEVYYLNQEEFNKYPRTGKFEHIGIKRFGYQRKAALDNWRRLIFCELPQPSHCFESISYFLYEGTRSYFTLALMNSRLLEWRFSATSTNNMVSTAEIAGLPVPIIVFSTLPEVITTALGRLQSLYESGNFSVILSQINGFLHRESDIVHDFLAYLAETMLIMNKERQAEIKRFLDWLQNEIGASLDYLTGKTIIQNYLGDYQKNQQQVSFEKILDVLRKNQKNLQTDVSDVVFQDKLLSAYQASLQILLPIKARLASTDRLIDQIVYQLYGLTEEEIAVVEVKG